MSRALILGATMVMLTTACGQSTGSAECHHVAITRVESRQQRGGGARSPSGVLSPMGDFSRAMTVRQLVDLQAYLRSIR
jgi:hypothetical protein